MSLSSMISTSKLLTWSALLLTITFVACGDDDDSTMTPVVNSSSATIWDGPVMTFTKASGADPTQAANQDRLTDNVRITRGNSGGQIFNAAVETSSDKDNSPEGTLWAIGTLSEVNRLSFNRFRTAVGDPKTVVGKDLVAFLQTDSIFLSVKFSSWDTGRRGGFSYERSTEQ